MQATAREDEKRSAAIAAVRSAIDHGEIIHLPRSADAENLFAGEIGAYHYLFEGEDDLLHIAITRIDKQALSPEDAQAIVSWLLPGMPTGLVWIRPGEFSQHFYCGHDDLLAHVKG